MITEVLGGVAAKLAGLGVAAKAGIGVGVATAAITTAGVAGMVPMPGLDSGGQKPAIEVRLPEVRLPEVPTAHAEPGLEKANDALSVAAGTNVGSQPQASGKPEVTGIERARQGPAGEHIPAHVPGPPANVPHAGTDAASTGLDRASQTPAADHIPSFVPGPPPNVGPAAGHPGAGSTGVDIARQTPAAGRLPR